MSNVVPGNQSCFAVDASSISVGAVLQQQMDSQWKPISFFSKKLTPTKTRYSKFRRELQAAYSAIRYFQHLLEERTFYMPLSGSDRYLPHETRHLDYLLQFTSDIRFIKGCENVPTDAMSRGIHALLLDLCVDLWRNKRRTSNYNSFCKTTLYH